MSQIAIKKNDVWLNKNNQELVVLDVNNKHKYVRYGNFSERDLSYCESWGPAQDFLDKVVFKVGEVRTKKGFFGKKSYYIDYA